MDPSLLSGLIQSIAGVLSSGINQVGSIITNKQQSKLEKQRVEDARRMQEGAPLPKNWFAEFGTNNTKQNYTIVLVLIMAIMLGIVAMAFSKSKD